MVAFVLGSLAGLALGLVGGGGSIVTVPLLVGPLGLTTRAATTMSLVIVGVSAGWASVTHAARGNVLWGRALVFGGIGVLGTLPGSYLNRAVPARLLLAGFVVLMVVAAIATWRRASRAASIGGAPHPSPSKVRPTADGVGSSLRGQPGEVRPNVGPLAGQGRFLLAAVGVGLLTGFFGVGGGFLIVPALLVVARLPMSQAIGTSLAIIAINSATALLGHLGSGTSIDPTITILFTAGAIVAGVAGGLVSTRLSAMALGRGFAAVVLTLAVYLSLQVI